MPDREPTDSLRPIEPASFGYAQARHLLWRAGFGGPPDQVRALAEWGPELSVRRLVRVDEIGGYPRPASDAFESDLMREPTLEELRALQRARQRQDEEAVARFRAQRQRNQRADRGQIRDMQRWWLERMIETPRPLEEKMTLFWHGHFATSYRTIENSYHMFMQNTLFRERAVGNFGELLFRIIRDPAMIRYLNNDRNRRNAPNENLARELMELFSLGEGNYTERDIREGARALTGWTFRDNEFWLNRAEHDDGDKRILGRRGKLDGDGFVRAILEQRECSEFVCLRLYEFFVADLPAEGDPARGPVERVVRSLAGTLRRNEYEVAPVLERLFRSEHFYDPLNMASRIKSPVELVVGAVRSMRTPVRDLGILSDALGLMGQSLFFPPNVAGWDGGRAWINTSTLFVRQNILTFLLTGKTPQGYDPLADLERYDPTALLDDLARTDPGADRDVEKVCRFLTTFALGRAAGDRHAEVLERFLEGHGGRVNDQTITGALALITAMPEYQLC
jgi:uncharacterized protein (DUF1800 family)